VTHPRAGLGHGSFRRLERLVCMEDIIGILIPVTFVAMLIIERVFPARTLPKVRRWLPKGILFFVISAGLNGAIPPVLAAALGGHAPLHLGTLPLWAAVPIGLLASDALSYAVHRLLHNVPFLWRWTHQMHHSAERLDMAGAVYFHPFDTLAQGAAPSLVVLLLGLSPDAAAIVGFMGFFVGMFQHINVRTPQWLGYFIQRPEAHSVHHARGVHAYNYGNLPIWDILLGTFRNPTTFTEPTGFWDGASSQVGAMLLGRDIGDQPAVRTPAAVPATSHRAGRTA